MARKFEKLLLQVFQSIFVFEVNGIESCGSGIDVIIL